MRGGVERTKVLGYHNGKVDLLLTDEEERRIMMLAKREGLSDMGAVVEEAIVDYVRKHKNDHRRGKKEVIPRG